MKRKILKDLKKWKESKHRKPLILKGARQVGKTWILKEFGKKEFANYKYLNFEDDYELHGIFEDNLDPLRILRELSYYFNHDINQNTDILIFDEVQKCPRALTSLKYFCEQLPKLAICSAGSLLSIFHSDSSFPVGKVNLLELHPLDFVEYCQGTKQERYIEIFKSLAQEEISVLPKTAHKKLWELWKEYTIVGGMPEVVECMGRTQDRGVEKYKIIRRLQQDLINTFTADIAKNSGRMNALTIERLWRNVPQQLARTVNSSAPKFRFKDAVKGLRGYNQIVNSLDWLEKAGLIIKSSIIEQSQMPLSAYSAENRFKLYFFDTGLLGAMSSILPKILLQMNFGSYKGYLAENFVAQELKANGISNLYCWTGRTSEIEFLLETGEGIIPVEVKSGFVTKSKSLKVYYEKYNPPKSIIISAKESCDTSKKGITKIPLYCAGLLPCILKI